MPISIKTKSLKYKDPVTGQYKAIDAVGQQLTWLAQAYAKGTKKGEPVVNGQQGWQDNSKYYANLAKQYMQRAEEAVQRDTTDIDQALIQIQSTLNQKIDRIVLRGLRLQFYSGNNEVGYCQLADRSITYEKLSTSVQNAVSKMSTAMTIDVYDPLGLGQGELGVDPYTYSDNQNNTLKAQLLSTDTYTIDGVAYTGLRGALTGILARAKEYGDGLVETGTYIVDNDTYTGLEAALQGVLQKAKNYADVKDLDLLNNHVYTVDSTSYTGLIATLTGILNKANTYTDQTVSSKTYTIDGTSYTGVIAAFQGILNKSKDYVNTQIDAYVPYSISIVSSLPAVGADRTFYLIEKEDGNYEKWWYIDDGTGTKVWDQFGGGSSTKVVSSLPIDAEADANIDYIVKTSSGYLYQKWINNKWEIIAGSLAVVVDEEDDLPVTGNAYTDYYKKDGDIYLHYRWIGNEYVQVGGAGNLDAYTKEEIDSLLDTQATSISSIQTNVTSLGTNVDRLDQTVRNLDLEGLSYYAELTQNEESNYVYTLYEVDGQDETVKSQFVLPAGSGGGGGTSATTLIVERITPSPFICSPSDKVEITINFSSTDSEHQTIDGSYVLKKGTTTIMSGSLIQGRNSFDITKQCSIGTQKFTLTVTDQGGSVNVKSWTVQVVDVGLTSSFNDKIIYKAGSAVNFIYTPLGAIEKTVHFKLDGQNLTSFTTSSSNIQQSYTISAQSHGSHLLQCWITATVGSTQIETDHIFKDIIWADETSEVPIIGCIYRYDHYGEVSVKQYNTLNIPYYVYDPNANTTTVILQIDGEEIDTIKSSVANHVWNFKHTEKGTHILKIKCRSTEVIIHVNVTELGYQITPITANLAFDFNPSGLSNTSTNRLWQDSNNNNIKMTVSDNFDWNNGGYQLDNQGNSYFCVKSGTRAYINYNLFGVDPKDVGSEFKIIFKTTNVKNSSASFLNCMTTESNADVGLTMNVHNANIKHSSNQIVLDYSEQDIIEFEYNINPLNSLVESESFIMSYEDGVAYRVLLYGNSDRLYQYEPVPITIGSDDCDVYIYRMKAYESSLSYNDILANFIADSRSVDQMIARYERNQIFDENGNLTPEYLAQACPDLRIIMIDAPHFTNDKNDYVKNTNVRCIYKKGDPILDNWVFENGYHAGQGTTSNAYGLAGRNIDIIFGFDGQNQVVSKIPLDPNYVTVLTLGDGETKYLDGSGKISLTRNSVPNNWFNIKVNIASSENANNALLQKRYNDYLPYRTPAMMRNPKVKNSMEFVNCVIFVRENDLDISQHREFGDTNWHFYGIGNIGDSKKTDNTRVNDPTDLKEFVVEISDNTLQNATFDTGVYRDTNNNITYNYQNGYETVYPITQQQWSGTNGYIQVTEPQLLTKENLPLFYELSNNTYILTQDSDIDTNKTYYRKNYLNTKYQSLYLDRYIVTTNESTGEKKVSQEYGWDTSFEFRYDMGTKDGETLPKSQIKQQQKESKQVFRNMYEFVIMSSDTDFVNHFGDWFITESPLYWYLFTQRYTMMDNRAKNSFWHWGKTYISETEAQLMGDDAQNYTIDNAAAAINNGYRFDLWDYDNDTALGIDNNGQMTRPYGLEDDVRLPNGVPAFNAANSVFWKRIRGLMGSQLRSMYQSRESLNCWKAESLIKEFDDWQEQFPEELWRLDIERKYLRTYQVGNPIAGMQPTNRFLKDMMNGRKKYQRRQFERNQQVYIGTKYFGANQCSDSTAISFRCNTPVNAAVTPNYTLRIVPYSDMYLWVAYGNSSPSQIRAKAGIQYEFKTNLTVMDETQVLIYCAENIMALNDLSALYIHANNFGQAKRLKTLIIGSNVEGYSNPYLELLGMGNNTLLETLDIRNCPNLTGSLNLESCVNLQILLAEGTNITGVTFAPYGNIKISHLPGSIRTLTFQNINLLTDLTIDGYNNLATLICEYSNLDSMSLVQNAQNVLQDVRILGLNWTIPNTNLLKAIYNMKGKQNILEGDVYITGLIGNSDIEAFKKKWPDLNLIYNPENLIVQYQVTYVNADENETVLYTTHVNQGDYPPDPYFDGELEEMPTIPPSGRYEYIFGQRDDEDKYVRNSGWIGLYNQITGPTTIKAFYTEKSRTFTVTWYEKEGVPLKTLSDLAYGSEVVYQDSSHPIPTIDTSGQESLIFKVFKGWDKSTGSITEDLDVYAVWDIASGVPASTTPMNRLSAAEIYAVCKTNNNDETRWPINGTSYVEMFLGHDFDFDNVESIEIGKDVLLEGISRDTYSGNNGYYFKQEMPVTTDIKLFEKNEPFTIAIDFQFSSIKASDTGATLISSYLGNSKIGFRLFQNSSGQIILEWGSSSSNISQRQVGYLNQRDIVILRYPATNNYLYIYYSYNSSTYSFDSSTYSNSLSRNSSPLHSEPLTFGGIHYGKNESGQDVYRDQCQATLHWCKIWKADLGSQVCRTMAQWPREKIRMEYYGKGRFYNGGGADPVKGSWICNSLLGGIGGSTGYNSSTGVGYGSYSSLKYRSMGSYPYSSSTIRSMLRNRIYPALPYEWQSIIAISEIKQITYNSSTGTTSTSIISDSLGNPTEKLFIPTTREIGNSSTTQIYQDEMGLVKTSISWLSTNNNRIKFKGIIRNNYSSTNIVNTSGEPTTQNDRSYPYGTIWVTGSQAYILMPRDFFEQYGITPVYNVNESRMPNTGGGWYPSMPWWTRTLSPSSYYYYVNGYGNPSNTQSYSYSYTLFTFCYSI